MPPRGRALARLLGVGLVCVSPLLLAALPDADAPRAAAPGLTVETDTAQEVRFSFEVPAIAWRQVAVGDAGAPRWEAAIAGFTTAGSPGQARLPREGGWLVVPPSTRPQLEVVQESWQTMEPRPVAVAPIPVLRGDPLSEDVSVGEIVPKPGEDLPLGSIPEGVREEMARAPLAQVGSPAVSLGEMGWWRGRRVVSYTICPVQVDGADNAVRTLSSGAWRVRFVPDVAFAKTALPAEVRGRPVARGDERFASLFLNGAHLTRWPTEAGARGEAPPAAPAALKARQAGKRGTPLGYPEVRLPVPRTQLYRVRAQQLRTYGLLPNEPIQKSQIRLYQRRYYGLLDDASDDQAAPYVEVEVPILMGGEGDQFDANAWFVFWGLRTRDDTSFTTRIDGEPVTLPSAGDDLEANNDYNVYWLQVSEPDEGEDWARMPATMLPAATGTPLASYRRSDYYEEALAYRENPPSATADRAYYNQYLADQVNVSLFLWSPVADQTGATIDIGISGFSAYPRTLAGKFIVRRYGQDLEYPTPEFLLDTVSEVTRSIAVPSAALSQPAVTFRLVPVGDLQNRLWAFLNWVRIGYDARYVAIDGRLPFNAGPGSGANDLEVTGFTTNAVTLLEVTDPRAPRQVALSAQNLVGSGSDYRLSLQVDQSGGGRSFYAVSDIGGEGISDIRYFDASLASGVPPTQLAGGDADLLVVCHPNFRAAAQRWLDHRQARAGTEGLSVQVVAPQDVYDWYSGGLKNPWAIKRLCNHALNSPTWGTYALMLIGDANENARQLGVTGDFAAYSGDYVPTHLHLQTTGQYLPEMLAADKWYAFQLAGDNNFPNQAAGPWEMYVGRFPCNSVEQLDRMIDKTIQVETVQPGETWRRRGIFFADDEYSFGSYDVGGGTTLAYQAEERKFGWSEGDTCTGRWVNNGGMVPLEADTVLLHDSMQDLYGSDPYLVRVARSQALAVATPRLLASLNRGGLLAHYQGHGNAVVMAHEYWFLDDRRTSDRLDVDLLTNVGRPWLYFGMGCHLADWAQYTIDQSGVPRNSLCEKFLGWIPGGAYACYGSSGYEYLTPNFDFSNVMIRRWMMRPPTGTVGGETVASRWMLGELMWASEADMLSINSGVLYRQMVSQYTLLGDPLLMLDCGPPVIEATLDGEPISGEVALEAVDETNQRTVLLRARDEAGIAGLQVLDSTGADLTAAVVRRTTVVTPSSSQIVDYELTLPVRPFAHQITVHVRDTSDRLPTDDHTTLVFNVHHTYEFTSLVDGEATVIEPTRFTFTPGEPVAIAGTITTSSYVSPESEITLTGDGLVVSDVHVVVGRSRDLTLSFTAEAVAGTQPPRSVLLTVDGYTTSYLLEAGAGAEGAVTLRDVMNFPNPMREETRFVMRTNLGSGEGKVQVYTVSGRLVAVVPFAVGGGELVVPWDGRDREGDRIANGVYLYRVQLEGSAGKARSGMQRLVVMR